MTWPFFISCRISAASDQYSRLARSRGSWSARPITRPTRSNEASLSCSTSHPRVPAEPLTSLLVAPAVAGRIESTSAGGPLDRWRGRDRLVVTDGSQLLTDGEVHDRNAF